MCPLWIFHRTRCHCVTAPAQNGTAPSRNAFAIMSVSASTLRYPAPGGSEEHRATAVMYVETSGVVLSVLTERKPLW